MRPVGKGVGASPPRWKGLPAPEGEEQRGRARRRGGAAKGDVAGTRKRGGASQCNGGVRVVGGGVGRQRCSKEGVEGQAVMSQGCGV